MAIPLDAFSELLSRQGGPAAGQLGVKAPDDEEDKGLVAKFFGVPVGLQLGTWAGLTGVPAFLVDVLTDPVTWLLPGLGSLTRTGEAARVISKGADLLPLAEKAMAAGARSLPEVQAFWKTPLMRAAQMETSSFSKVRDLLQPMIEAGDKTGLLNTLKDMTTMVGDGFVPASSDLNRMISSLEIGGPDALSSHLEGLISNRTLLADTVKTAFSTGDKATAIQAMRDISRNAPSLRWKQLFSSGMRSSWKAAFDEAAAGSSIAPLAEGAEAQAAAGQRALLSVNIPGRGRIPLIRGAPIVGAVGGAAEKLGFGTKAVQDATLLDAPLSNLPPSPYSLGKTITESAQQIRDASERTAALPTADITGPALLTTRTNAMRDTIRMGDYLGGAAKTMYEGTMRNLGLSIPDDGPKITELLQDPEKYYAARDAAGSFVTSDLTDEAKKLGITNAHQQIAETIRQGFVEYGNLAMDRKLVDGLLPDYANRIVELVPGKEEEARKAMSQFVRPTTTTTTWWANAQKRTIPGWEDLLKLEARGLVTVEKDPGVLLRKYVQSFGRVSANASFLDSFAVSFTPKTLELGEAPGVDALHQLLLPGNSETDKLAAASGRYLRVGPGDPEIMGLARQIGDRTGLNGFGATHVWVLDTVARQLKEAVERGFPLPAGLPETATGTERAMSYALQANAVAKAGLLFPGTVHLVNLTTKALVVNGWDAFKQVLSRVVPELVQPAGTRSILEELPDMAKAISLGLALYAPLDADLDVLQRGLRAASGKIPFADKIADVAGWANGKLWAQYHSPLKFWSYRELLARGLLKFPGQTEETIGPAIADHVNQAFGGGNLEKLLAHRKSQQLARLAFVAPDWLVGNVKVATDVFANLFATPGQVLTPADVLGRDVRAFFARQYAMRAGLTMVLGGNLANLAFTGHFMWDNEDPTKIQLPGADDKGRPIYMAMFDPFLFPYNLASQPFNFAGRKLSPLARTVVTQLTGRDMFGAPIVTGKDGPLTNLLKRVGFVASEVTPIGLQTAVGAEYGHLPVAYRLASAAGLPIRGSPADVPPALKAAADASSKGMDQQIAGISDAHELMMRNALYRRQIETARHAALYAVPPYAVLPVAQ